MTETFFIRPASPGADIRDPATCDRLPAEGAAKPRDPYWLGLLLRGDVVEGQPEPDAGEPQPAEPDPAPRKR